MINEMDSLCKKMKKELKPLGNDRLEVEYTYDAYMEREYVNVYIEDEIGKFRHFGIDKEIGGKVFEISYAPHTDRGLLEKKGDSVLFYYESIMSVFATWLGTQKEFRLQYMLGRDSIMNESIMIQYIRSLKKDLT